MTGLARRPQFRHVRGMALVYLYGLVLAVCAIEARLEGALAADGASEMFDLLDESRDGVVSRAEFLRMKTEIFYRALTDLDQDQRLSPEDINIAPEAFADADLNGDGKISGAEFVQARFTQFEAIDANGDQEITFEEFREFTREYQL